MQELRQQFRALRGSLSSAERQQAMHAVAGRVSVLPIFANAIRIAGYWACNGELDPAPLLERAWAMNQQVYLPVLVDTPQESLQFAPYHPDSRLRRNCFNIPEPDVSATEWLPPAALDLVLTPLVAFDLAGTRLGMGGGFYDRSFAFLHDARYRGHRPFLLGLAYEVQKATTLVRQPWDVPLDGIATETALYRFPERDGAG